MNTKILVSLMTILALLAVIPGVLATSDVVNTTSVEVDGMYVGEAGNTIRDVAVEAGQVVPLRVEFKANKNASDVEISAWIRGHRSDSVSKNLPDLINGSEYNAKLALRIPSDLDETEEDLTLVIEIETDEGSIKEEYTLKAQREPYKANILFVEADRTVVAGSSLPVDVVVKNLGRHELKDLVVSVGIPELGLEKRAYFGDLTPTDICDDCDKEDAVEKRIYLKVPVSVNAGDYELVVEVYGEDTSDVVKKNVEIIGTEEATQVIVPVSSKELSTGETKTYTLVLVNAGRNIGVYEIIPETAEGVIVSVSNPVVTVPAGSSKAVEVEVKAGSREGTYNFAVNINSQDKLVKRVVMNANVVEGKIVSGNLTILTIVLAIIFVVLLIVLIVLLTRKPTKSEELEESYY